MKITSSFVRFHKEFGLKKTIDIFSEAGFEGIDFGMDLEEYYTDVHEKSFYQEIKDYARERGVVFSQTHAPYESAYVEEERSKKRFDEIVTGIKHSSYLGAEMVVVHPCRQLYYKENNNYDKMMEYNYHFYKNLIPYAQEYQLKIAIENIRISVTEEAKGLLELLNALDHDVFTVCFDAGHAHMCMGDAGGMVRELGDCIGCTHIHDNDRSDDLHTLPFYGTVDWEDVMKAFAEVEYQGNLNFEAGLFLDPVPVSLRGEGAKYMAKVGNYLADRYEYYKNEK